MKKADATRLAILQKAFDLIYVNGYQATSIDDIIATTQVTKGAFYYHFKNKEEMGLAIINEIMYPPMHEAMVAKLAHSHNPIEDLYQMMRDILLANPYMQVRYGCPAHNLIQEMSPLSTTFQAALGRLVNEWKAAIETCVNTARQTGKMKPEVDAEQVAITIMAGYGGIRNLGKVYNHTGVYEVYLAGLKKYLNTLG